MYNKEILSIESVKAYEINLERIREGYLYTPIYCYANSRGEAKKKLLHLIRYEELRNNSGDLITYLNIPIKRAKNLDKVEYNGTLVTKEEMNRQLQIIDHNKKLQQVLDDPTVTHAYIYKFGRTFYRSNYCGYTERKSEAGVYTKEAAVKECMNSLDFMLVPINNQEHNEMIREKIVDLESRMLPESVTSK